MDNADNLYEMLQLPFDQYTTDMGLHSEDHPPFLRYKGMDSFFGGSPPLSEFIGYSVVLGFGIFFSLVTSAIVFLNKRFRSAHGTDFTSEHFNTAGRMMKTGLTASAIVSKWTWAATLLQSSNVAWAYGVSGPFWYAAGASIQLLLFGILAIALKQHAPKAHTICEIVDARWGRAAHKTFLFFCLLTNVIVTSMLLLGGSATVEALTGIDRALVSFLMPWGIVLYTAYGGLQATMVASYFHTVVLYGVLFGMIFIIYIKVYSSDLIYQYLDKTASYTEEECKSIYSDGGITFFEPGEYACGPVSGNQDGSYLTMMSLDGLIFGIINVIGNFGTVFVDQSYWQSAIAARPESAGRGFLLASLCWFAIPFSLATSLGLAANALMLPINAGEAGSGLVPPAVATEVLGDMGSLLILVMVFMAVVSTGAAEANAVSSLFAYDIYRTYWKPRATGQDILKVSRIVIVVYGLFMGCLSLILDEIGVNLGWVYCFMGIVIGSAVFPLWNLLTWRRASGTGAIIAAWVGLFFGLFGWFLVALLSGGKINVDTLGGNSAMLSGNLFSVISSGLIHYIYSKTDTSGEYDFAELDKKLTLVEEDDIRGLTEEERDPEKLARLEVWVKRRAYVLTILLVVIWPLLTIPAGKFSESYFSFWVLVAIAWGFAGAFVLAVLPLTESTEEIDQAFHGVLNFILCRTAREANPRIVPAPSNSHKKRPKDVEEQPTEEFSH